jgi:hypothetical protein
VFVMDFDGFLSLSTGLYILRVSCTLPELILVLKSFTDL